VAILFRDRKEAGLRLGEALSAITGPNVVVLGIPRGGVIVADYVSRALKAPMDVVITRKIEAPGEPEFALGAVTQEGEVIIDRQAAESLGATSDYLDAQIELKRQEVKERLVRLRGDAPYPDLESRVVVIVDDGIATGSSVGAAVMSVRKRNPKEIVVAVPVAPQDAVDSLKEDGARVVCLHSPREFMAIGEFYSIFDQVEDGEVKRILEENRARGF